MKSAESSREIFRRIASSAETASGVLHKPLRSSPYVEEGQSIIALIRTNDRVEGIKEAVNLLGGLEAVLNGLDGYVLVKPNLNSDDAFPGSVHPVTLRTTLQLLLDNGVPREEIVVGDMSGPRWLPTRKVMKTNGALDVIEEFGVRPSFFDEEKWVKVKPDKATTWPDGLRLAKTVYDASRIISLPCLKTHKFGGIFTLSLKNAVGVINPVDRNYLHRSEKMRFLIAEINLAYSCDFVILDGMKCFISGGPAKGDEASPGIIIAGSDRVAIDGVGAAILKSLNATGLADTSVHSQEQLKRAAEVGLGHLSMKDIALKTSNLARDKEFPKLLRVIKDELR